MRLDKEGLGAPARQWVEGNRGGKAGLDGMCCRFRALQQRYRHRPGGHAGKGGGCNAFCNAACNAEIPSKQLIMQGYYQISSLMRWVFELVFRASRVVTARQTEVLSLQ
jgi:hypothetical protein